MAATTRNAIAAGKPPELVSVGHRFNTGEKEALRSLAESDRPADQRRALEYLPYFQQSVDLIAGGNRRFRLTLQACWKLGQAAEPDNTAAFDAFIASLVR
jgi:hypothetical protein